MAEVVLVQPKVGNWDDFRSHPSLPLALLSASRCVAKEFSTVFIDTRVDKGWKERLKEELRKNPLCVGVTSMTGNQIGYALEISNYVKKVSGTPVVWGGIHASLLPESTLANKNIDIIVTGEGELAFLELTRALAKKEDLKGIRGVWYKENNRIIKNPGKEFARLDDLPDLPLSLIDIEEFLPIFKGRRTFNIETSRGCPNQCVFCFNTAYNKNTWRAFSAERVIRELKYLSGHFNVRSFYVIDDNFFVDLKRARAIAGGMIDEGLDIIWEVQGITINSALKMDEDYMELLVRAGMKKVHFGIESGSDRVLKMVNKRLKVEDVIEINKKWSRYNIVTQYNFMCGFPEESMEDIRKTKDLALRLMKDNPRALISPFCPFTPYPGTALYQNSIDNGFIRKKELEEWSHTDYGNNLWESRQKKGILSSLFFVSMFLDKHRSQDMVGSKILKILIMLYRPIAKFRFRHLFFKFMPEIRVSSLLFK
ncbi:MAG: radical SAM protein [Candidatus Omnitrophica bacterium]|nr:radical SAM protein [Candidatus Omnitrophota bacterium]